MKRKLAADSINSNDRNKIEVVTDSTDLMSDFLEK